jgi:hypothetical protein
VITCEEHQSMESHSHKRSRTTSTSSNESAHSQGPKSTIDFRGGMLTSRSMLSNGPNFQSFAVRTTRLRIFHENPEERPQFRGCPAWSKPILCAEYQVVADMHAMRKHKHTYLIFADWPLRKTALRAFLQTLRRSHLGHSRRVACNNARPSHQHAGCGGQPAQSHPSGCCRRARIPVRDGANMMPEGV